MNTATAVAGMFLTLVLGLYIGSLLPGIFRTEDEQAVERMPTAQPTPPPAQQDAQIPPKLQQNVLDLEKRAAASPSSAPDWINLGNAYFDAQQYHKAIGAYEHSLTLAPRNADVLTDLGIMYREVGQYEKAVECFRKAMKVEDGHQNSMFNAGVVLHNDLHRHDEAVAVWEQLLKINPGKLAPDGHPLADLLKDARRKAAGKSE